MLMLLLCLLSYLISADISEDKIVSAMYLETLYMCSYIIQTLMVIILMTGRLYETNTNCNYKLQQATPYEYYML